MSKHSARVQYVERRENQRKLVDKLRDVCCKASQFRAQGLNASANKLEPEIKNIKLELGIKSQENQASSRNTHSREDIKTFQNDLMSRLKRGTN